MDPNTNTNVPFIILCMVQYTAFFKLLMDLLPIRTSNNPTMRPMAQTEEVYVRLNALFARWEPTVPSTVETTIVRYVDNL
uniref:Uncharacterized protein n=1 Tax=Moniliophthora roreri TaxID=221103 RepID=A0A0W0FSK0_MONRR